MKILVFAAHPDDEVLGCGGTIAKLAGRNEITLCIVTDGASAQYSDQRFIEIRKKAAEDASKLLGIRNIKTLPFSDQKLDLIPQLELNRTLEKVIDEERPEIIYTHSSHDINKDHRLTYESTMVACRPFRRKVKRLICYELPGVHLHQFEPNVYVDITDTIDRKLEAFKKYSTEIEDAPKPRSIDSIRAWAAMRGIESENKYAEAFRLVREIVE